MPSPAERDLSIDSPMTHLDPQLASVTRTSTDVHPRLARLRRLAWLLDASIPIGRYRIGLDPLLGLVPGFGDAIGAGMSIIILYDAARLGTPVHVLVRMVGNVLLELVVGAIPVLGDLFDFAWRANERNLRLVERHYDPSRDERPARRIATALAVAAALLFSGVVTLCVLVLHALWQLVWSVPAPGT